MEMRRWRKRRTMTNDVPWRFFWAPSTANLLLSLDLP